MIHRAVDPRAHFESNGRRERDRARCLRSDLPDRPLSRLLEAIREQREIGATPGSLEVALRKLAQKASLEDAPWKTEEVGTLLVLADLAGQGWTIEVARGAIWMTPPNGSARPGEAPAATKARMRAPLDAARQRQLAEPAVRKFIASMHVQRRHAGVIISIESLIDDGADLAARLAEVAALQVEERAKALGDIVDPVLEPVTSEARCARTGLLLRDVWRYFRHTWSLEYRPTPGRNVQFLIRNAARPNAPVMGIASLTNPVLQLEDRDDWIGWSYGSALARIATEKDFWPKLRTTLIRALARAKDEIRYDDLIDSFGVSRGDALERSLVALGHLAAREREAALREQQTRSQLDDAPSLKTLPRDSNGDVDWAQAGSSPLFRAKRARALAELLAALRGLERTPVDGSVVLAVLKQDREMDRSFRTALRELRKRGLASRILEVNICGAVPPYRDLLGGKLVALSLATSEVRDYYRSKYCGLPSEIASKMAGRPIVHENDVCILTTTSLYSVGSSQYNRLRVAAGATELHWREIGATRGFGTVHFRDETVSILRQISITKRGLRNVNNVFGEGTSPLLRQMREGLAALSFEANDILEHNARRLIYAIELYPGACDDLLFDRSGAASLPSMETVADGWRRRWLVPRIARCDVLARVALQGPASVASELGVPRSPPTLFDFLAGTGG